MKTKLVKGFSVYMIGALFQKGINFLLVPVYLRLISREEYGLLDLSNTLIVLLCILFSAGLPTIWQGDFFKLNNDSRKKLMEQILSTYVAIIGPLAFLVLVVLQLTQSHILGPGTSVLTAAVITLTGFLTLFQTVFRNTLELSSKPWIYVSNSVVIGLIASLVNVGLVVVFNTGYIGALCGTLVGLVLTFGHAYYEWKKRGWNFNFHFDMSEAKHLLKVGLPFISIPLAYWVLTSSDRWFILGYFNTELLGVYGVATKFSSVFDPIIIAPIMSMYTPIIYKKFANHSYKQHLALLAIGAVGCFALMSVVVVWVANLVITREYSGILPLIPIQIIGFSFYLVAQMSNCLLIYLRRSKETLYIICAVAAINLVLNFFLVEKYGLMGASISFLVANFCWMLLSLWRNKTNVIAIEAA